MEFVDVHRVLQIPLLIILHVNVETLTVKARFVHHQKANVAMEFVDVHRVLQIPILILLHVNVNQLIHVVDVQQEEPV